MRSITDIVMLPSAWKNPIQISELVAQTGKSLVANHGGEAFIDGLLTIC